MLQSTPVLMKTEPLSQHQRTLAMAGRLLFVCCGAIVTKAPSRLLTVDCPLDEQWSSSQAASKNPWGKRLTVFLTHFFTLCQYH